MKRRKRHLDSFQSVAEQATAYGVSLPPQPAERYLSPNDIGKILNLTGEAIKHWIYLRRLPAVKLANGFWKVRVSDFQAFVKARGEVGRRRVLVFCSDPMDDVATAISILGCEAVVTSNYANALLKAGDCHPALFVIECSAPDSWKLTQKIRGTKALRQIPIVLIGAKELSAADAEKAIEVKAAGYLKRPVDGEVLKRELERALGR